MNETTTLCLEIIFWLALFVVFYTYLGYGIVLYILVKLKELFVKPVKRSLPASDADLPEVTLFITAFNEEDVVDEKMENSLELDYPADKLHIVWVTDGSDDGTNERLQTHWQEKATVHFQPLRQGKTAAMTRGMTLVDTPLVVFTDANTMVNREAIREIVLAFQDPKVGCVAGEKRIAVQTKDGAAAGGEGIYWKYESTLKALDARLYSAVGAAGELFVRSDGAGYVARRFYSFTPDHNERLHHRLLYECLCHRKWFGRYARRRKTKSAHRCGRIAVYLAASSVAESFPIRDT